MDINLTLIGQMITFAIFVWFTTSYVWPPLIAVMDARREKIAKGILSAEKGDILLKSAKNQSESLMLETKKEVKGLIDKANQQAKLIIEKGKLEATAEGNRLLLLKKVEINQVMSGAKKEAIIDLASIVIYCTKRIMIDDEVNTNNKKEKRQSR